MLASCLFASSIFISLLQIGEPPVAADYQLHEANLYQVASSFLLISLETICSIKIDLHILEIFG
jgi:hypothetical protein